MPPPPATCIAPSFIVGALLVAIKGLKVQKLLVGVSVAWSAAVMLFKVKSLLLLLESLPKSEELLKSKKKPLLSGIDNALISLGIQIPFVSYSPKSVTSGGVPPEPQACAIYPLKPLFAVTPPSCCWPMVCAFVLLKPIAVPEPGLLTVS